MQIAVVPDVQGNLMALSSAIAEIEKLKESGRKIEKIYILGLLGYFPYPKEVVELVKNSKTISAVRGKFDHLIARWSEIDEIEDFPDYIIKTVEWNWRELGKLRAWLRNELPAFLVENFGNNRFLFVYGDPFNPVNGEILPKKPTSYYEQFTSPLKYDLIVVSSKEPFIAETRHGKIVCAGSIVRQTPTFAVIDTKTTDVSFFDFEFNRKSVEDRIKEKGLPKELIEILYRGY
ncbi:metallophosphatase family protein [Archaeoglobales archaeon]|nr:MAG: metallophosphatase family protein [Archaeoglobales archaeon]